MPVDDNGVHFTEPDLETLKCMSETILPETAERIDHLLALAALGVTLSTWRNSPVEAWHANARIRDGGMMRVNAYTTDAVHKRLIGWCREVGVDTGEHRDRLDDIDPEDFAPLAVRLYRWMVNSTRKLPTGQTLKELGRADLLAFTDHAGGVLGGWIGQGERHGTLYPFLRAAATGSTCPWWGAPQWPARVELMLSIMDDPTHRHWGEGGAGYGQVPQPPGIADRKGLRRKLLHCPWNLDEESAQWFTDHGFGLVRVDPERLGLKSASPT